MKKEINTQIPSLIPVSPASTLLQALPQVYGICNQWFSASGQDRGSQEIVTKQYPQSTAGNVSIFFHINILNISYKYLKYNQATSIVVLEQPSLLRTQFWSQTILNPNPPLNNWVILNNFLTFPFFNFLTYNM